MTSGGPAPRDLAQALLTIDLRALADNWRLLRDRIAPTRCGAVVKANAYGTGLEQAVLALRAAGCDAFFVAHPHEGVSARAALGGRKPSPQIFILNGLAANEAAARACAEAALIPVIGCEADAALWREQAQTLGRKLPVALMFDTGMNRLGYDWRAAAAIARAFGSHPVLEIVLVASHFISSDAPNDATNATQIERFETVRRAIPHAPASLANSSGLFLAQAPYLDLARPGYALYGGNPTPGRPNPMRAVVRLQAPILQLREIEAGESVGYDAQWTARRKTRLAAIGLGYADGLPRNAMATDQKPGGEAIVAGLRCPFAGRVSMDITTIDVTEVPEHQIGPGALVELLGDAITIDDLGGLAGTIGYEILTALGGRYAREWVG